MYSSYSVAAAVCSVIFPVLAIVAVALRFRARSIKGQRYAADDYIVVLALAFAIALCCLVLYGSFAASIGQDLKTLTKSEYESYSMHIYFAPICAYPAYGLAKISVLELYKRIFAIKKFLLVANCIIVAVICWMLAALLVQIFSAWPIDQFWTFGGHFDMNFGGQAMAFAVLDIFLDIVTLCLPLPVIGKLHMDRSHRIKLIGIFWLGIFCVVAASVRLYFTYELSHFGNAAALSKSWFSYVSVNTLIWGEIESCCSIIAACLPTYGALLQHSSVFKPFTRGFSTILDMLNTRRTQASSANSFSLGRKHEGSASESNKAISASDVQGSWYPLKDVTNTTAISQDIERGSVHDAQNITVERSFVTRVESK